jgi:cytochrome bd-type quinol oxidase subunit 1
VKIVFWLSLIGLLYTYVGYPAIMWMLACVRPRPWTVAPITPTEDGSSILLAKQAMVVRETTAVFGHFTNEGVALLMIVMQMHFRVTDAKAHDFG